MKTTPSTSAQGPVAALIDKTEKLIDAADSMSWSCNSSEADEAIREAREAVRAMLTASPSPAASPASPSGDAVHEALREAEAAFETIRVILINELDEPVRRAFWRAVEARDSLRALHLGFPEPASLASDAPPARDWRPVLTEMVAAMNIYGHEVADGEIPSAHRSLMWRAEQLLAKPASEPAGGVRELAAAQITMGRGLVDVTKIDHEGRSGILFRPRARHVPLGQEGELQPGEYWPVAGDVVIWIENEGGAQVIAEYLAPFLALSSSAGPAVESVAKPVYRITKRGAFVEPEPLLAAFDMADGEHDLYAHPAPATVEMPETHGPYEARICKDMPAECCDYGVVSLSEGREVCRVWREQDARAIAAALAPATEGRKS